MDDSLDNYISKANFKVKVGNPRFKGNPGQNPATGGFQGKRKFGGHQSNQVTNVSITVPAVRKTAVNKNSTNQIRDARDRLVSKTKPVDARNKLNQKARNTDARQKLMAIRAKKEPVDARAKIQAKKQTQNTGTSNAQPGSFTLTRTVSNNSGGGGGNIHITPGTQGNVSITKTLTKVMPPGYDAVLGAPTKSLKPQNASKTSNVMKRLGTPAGQQSNIPNITRTITNPHKPVSKPQHMVQDHRAPVQQTHNIPYPPAQTNIPPYQHPQTNYTQPPPSNVPPYPVQQPPHHPVPASPPYPPPVQTTLPYPPQDPIASREFQHQVIPKIEVQNDQYRPPEPQYSQFATPPNPQYAPPPQQYTYTQPQQQYYQPPVDNIYTPPPARQEMYQAPPESYRSSQSSSSGSSFMKTIVNDVKPDRHFSAESSPLKRKSFDSSSYESSSASSSGPLRSSTINYIPVIETTGSVSSSKTSQKPKLSKVTAPGEPAVKRLKQEDEENVISPLQGYKVSITNLASSVTQDDIIELFGAVGAVKSVKVVKNGIAEVVYVKKESAQEATKTYHDRELDGLPMVVKMVTPISARIKEAPEKLPPTMKPSATGPLELSKKSVVKPRSSQKDVDVTTLHKALFKTGTSGSSKPVTFTVNI